MKNILAPLALTLIAAPALAQDKMTVMLDWFINPDHGPIILAQENGYFTDAGLEVELISPADPNEPPRMVAAGR
ncbi:MAG TPA: ABC transporter ATP-binding protein, partial [Sulfitobacter sp.]|nr:ABC transporter ATP-binding protein [Sulfitobacter sp.]